MALRSTSTFSIATMAMLAMVSIASFTIAQDADCAQKLIPCADYLNSTSPNPPDTCCNPIKEAVATQLPCLCTLYTTPGLLESLGASLTDALRLTEACGVPVDMTKCNSPSSAPQSAPPPPAAGKDGNDADRRIWSGIGSVFLVSASAMLLSL